MSSCDIRKSLTGCIDKIVGIREDMGAQLADVFLITRAWSGRRVGEGSFSEKVQKISPTPEIVDFSHDVRIVEAGAVKAGDLLLRGLSRNKYPDELELRTDTGIKNTEKLYKVGKHFYTLVNIKENFLTWDLQIRKIRLDETERR